jgi:hypothetical protein
MIWMGRREKDVKERSPAAQLATVGKSLHSPFQVFSKIKLRFKLAF